ncbi:MAG: phosphatase [Opitutaceae bacterium]|nr:phosphatase [Opitutaceae bacterium]
MPSPAVAVIDIGSNTIKVLVARTAADGSMQTELFQSLDARISTGISRARPELSREGMDRGLAAIRQLLAAAEPLQPVRTLLVATSAVRDAANGAGFRVEVKAATGHDIRILTGSEEANYIGAGLTCDPDLHDLQDFYVFDLGGGSLECLAFRQRRVQQAASLRLGCVRLTEKLFADSSQALPANAAASIAEACRVDFDSAGFRFDLPASAVAVGTGGTLTVARAIAALKSGATAGMGSSLLPVAELAAQFDRLKVMPLTERQRFPGLPPARADVYPTALATYLAIAQLGHFESYRHSLYNLRYGLAREMLAAVS